MSKNKSTSHRPTVRIPLDLIEVDYAFNCRRVVTAPDGESQYEGIKGLAESIKKEGQITPVIVRELTDKEKEGKLQYKLLCGFRRFEAVKSLDQPSIISQLWSPTDPAKLEQEEMFVNLIENEVRKNLKPWEKAQRFSEMKETLGISGRELARRLGESETYCNNLIALWSNLKRNPYLLDVWQKEVEKGITGLLIQTIGVGSYKGKSASDLTADEQMERWAEAHGVKPKPADTAPAAATAAEGGTNGDGNAKPDALVRATGKELAKALEYCKVSSAKAAYLEGVRAALAFAMGTAVSIPGVNDEPALIKAGEAAAQAAAATATA